MNIGGKSCADPAGRGPSSRGLSAGTYADRSRGVTIRLSSDVRPWPDGVWLGLAWASHPVGWHVGKKESRTPSLAPGPLAI